jgi:uncharacterized protein YecE (DUF72 family)
VLRTGLQRNVLFRFVLKVCICITHRNSSKFNMTYFTEFLRSPTKRSGEKICFFFVSTMQDLKY